MFLCLLPLPDHIPRVHLKVGERGRQQSAWQVIVPATSALFHIHISSFSRISKFCVISFSCMCDASVCQGQCGHLKL